MRPLPTDSSGCLHEECSLSAKCWRFVGAKLRTGEGWYSDFNPDNCQDFMDISEV